jgi:hypothetical protein
VPPTRVRQVGGVIGIAVLGAIVAHVSLVSPTASVAQHVAAGTNGVADAYWTGAAVMLLMAGVAYCTVRRREAA